MIGKKLIQILSKHHTREDKLESIFSLPLDDRALQHALEEIESWYPIPDLPPIVWGNQVVPKVWGYALRRSGKVQRITLSPLLKDVSYEAMRSVLWHEICHILAPPIRAGQRWSIHHRGFKKLEALDPCLEDSDRALRDYAVQFRVDKIASELRRISPEDRHFQLNQFKPWFRKLVKQQLEE